VEARIGHDVLQFSFVANKLWNYHG
jgi:hypothetical protein